MFSDASQGRSKEVVVSKYVKRGAKGYFGTTFKNRHKIPCKILGLHPPTVCLARLGWNFSPRAKASKSSDSEYTLLL
jgi:hypothetical protein